MDEEHLKQWIWESLLLDLAHDEEDETLAREAKISGPLNLDELLKCCNQPLTISDFLSAEPISEKLLDLDIQEKYFWHFKTLKWWRIKTSLEVNNAAKVYANDQKREQYFFLQKTSQKYNEYLNLIFLYCIGAMSSSIAQADQRGKEWLTIRGLLHSEACATARQEMSHGLAASYATLLGTKFVGFKIFDWVARHNMARGLNHMKKPSDASKILDYKVDSFKENINELLSELPKNKKRSDREDILYRLLYFPAVLTLTQALEDLNRHSERRFYLRAGNHKAIELNSKYWAQCFKMQMAFSDLDTKRNYTNFKVCNARTSVSKGVTTPKQTQLQYQLCGECRVMRRNTCPSWRESILWLLCWHACDFDQLCTRLQSTCERCHNLLPEVSAPKDKFGRHSAGIENNLVDEIYQVFKKDLKLLEKWVGKTKTLTEDAYWLNYLLGKNKTGFPFPYAARPVVWRAANALYRVLQDLKNLKGDSEFDKWAKSLAALLESEKFREFHSINDQVETLCPDPKWPKRCPASPHYRGKTKGTRTATCGSHGCAYRLLHLEDSDSKAKANNKQSYESLDYFFSVMAGQQERFNLYLKQRTGKMKYFRTGESSVPVPEFELVALRRWNSFSPNLGSRASLTVGGGYLVRLYDSSANRYLSVAVDPGYNFLENLFNEGFTVPDIDLVVVTHAHPDHTENLTNLFTLLRERSKRVAKDSKLNIAAGRRFDSSESSIVLAVTEGVFERYWSHFKSEKDYIRDIAVLRAKQCRGSKASGSPLWLWIDERTNLCHMDLGEGPEGLMTGKTALKIEAMYALHGDGTSHDSIGIVLTREKNGQQPVRLGLLSDSRYHSQLSQDYSECKVLIAHLGSLVDEAWYKDYNQDPQIDPQIRKNICSYLDDSPPEGVDCKEHSRERLYTLLKNKNHLYLPGLVGFLCDLHNEKSNISERLILLSEFGEELRGGLRKSLVRRLSKICDRNHGPKMHFMPTDVGLRVDIGAGTIFCSICHRYRSPLQIEAYSVLPSEEAIAYVCSDCKNSRSGEIDRLVEEWCHSGRPVVWDKGSESAATRPEDDLQPPKQS
jgi:hypothetical protein